MTEVKTIEQDYIDIFNTHRDVLNKTCGDYVNEQRQAAFDLFSSNGLPTKKDEDYRYTDASSFFAYDFGLDLNGATAIAENLKGFECNVPDMDAITIHLINGWYFSGNDTTKLPEGVILCSFAEASKKHSDLFQKYYNKQAQQTEDTTVHMNTMLAQDGVFLYVPKNVVIDKPIQIINVLNSKLDLLSTQRSLFVIEPFAKAQVLVCDHALSHQQFTANHVREVFVEDNASFEYYLVENQHNKVNQVISTFTHQAANTNVHSNVITLHNGNTRNNSSVVLAGQNAYTHLSGMALTDKQQHVDNFTTIDHAVPNCTSVELFKNVLDDTSTGAFKGRVLVREDAQKTAAFQTNNNICLTPTAYINTRPQLEIYADDVKCSHGATIGQLDDTALFYMKARGIGEKEARMLLMFAFTHEVIEQIPLESLRERIKSLVEARLSGEGSKCIGCALCE